MDFREFSRILKAFAYSPDDVCIEPGKATLQIHNEIIEVQLVDDGDGQIVVIENGVRIPSRDWIVRRLAHIDILAGRITDLLGEGQTAFLSPKGFLTRTSEEGEEDEKSVGDAVADIVKTLNTRIPGGTSVLYLTAAAGEGKTTIIQEIARRQADAYARKEANWLLVPIELGGRRIIRLDDHIAGSLANTFRFPYLYYGTFLELVKMGVLIPALDGFEEMFVENATREVLSALGSLLNALGSRGNMLIAARNAYFEYHGWETQSRLFDCIDKDANVLFSRLKIASWEKPQFCEYSRKRGLENPEPLYQRISDALGPTHPILVRPVLVEKLCTIVKDSDEESVDQILRSGSQEFFTQFIQALVQREANHKWIDVLPSSDGPARPLLSVEQHFDLLSEIALEMWRDSVEQVSKDMLDVITELFCSQFPDVKRNRQIQDRIKDHALLKPTLPNDGSYCFDHEEFRNFFLGQAIGSLIIKNDQSGLRTILRVGQVPPQSLETIHEFVSKQDVNVDEVIQRLIDMSAVEAPTSYSRENIGGVLGRLLQSSSSQALQVRGILFPSNALDEGVLSHVEFLECHFQPMLFRNDHFDSCVFKDCHFERIEIQSGAISVARDCRMLNCEISSFRIDDQDIYDPGTMGKRLEPLGFPPGEGEVADGKEVEEVVNDQKLVVAERALRAYQRATQVNENTLRQRLGQDSGLFFDSVLPVLMEKELFVQVDYRGAGHQKRFGLKTRMTRIEDCLRRCRGNFDTFVSLL